MNGSANLGAPAIISLIVISGANVGVKYTHDSDY